MKTRNIISVGAILLLFGSTMTACHEDDGNYDYTALDRVEIVTATGNDNDEDEYYVKQGQKLFIGHTVLFNGKPVVSENDAPLSYYWTIYSMASGAGVDASIDTIATSLTLDNEINRPSGRYYLQLTVVNDNTGVESYYRAQCTVQPSVSDGWMVLYERSDNPGNSDVGIVVNPLNKNGIFENEELWNVYSMANGYALEGEPVSIFHETAPLSESGSPRIVTTKDYAAVSHQDFSRTHRWEDFFFDPVPVGNIQFAGPAARMQYYSEALIMDNTLRVLDGGGLTSTAGWFGMPKESETSLGELAPWATSRNMNIMQTVVYSQTLGAFFYTVPGTNKYLSFVTQLPIAAFDVNNTNGAKLLFSDWKCGVSPTANYDYFLFANGDNRYIAEANFAVTGALPMIGTKYADVTYAPEVKNATTFAVNTTGFYAYYGSGNKLYKVLYDEGSADVAWSAPDANETVVCVRTQKHYFALFMNETQPSPMNVPNMGEVIHIATWNESTRQGKLYEYKIIPSNGNILTDGEHYEYVVPGKIKDMAYKFSM